MRRRESGALLLTVALLLAIVAALALGLQHAAGMDTRSVASDYERRKAAYLAQAAVAAAKWSRQLNSCNSGGIANFSFSGATLSVTVKGDKTVDLTGTATLTPAVAGTPPTSATLERDRVVLVDVSSREQKDLDPDLDTYLDKDNPTTSQNTSSSLVLTSNKSNALIRFKEKDVPANSEVVSEILYLTQNGGSATARQVDVHRVSTAWDGSATWLRAGPGATWNGGDYTAAPIVSAQVGGAGSYQWDVTGLMDGWVSGRVANNGLLLRLPAPGQSATFYSRDPKTSLSPFLRVTFMKPC